MSHQPSTRTNAASIQAHAEAIRLEQKSRAVIVLSEDEDGVITMVRTAGMNHSSANSVLSVGIHINLSDHDQYVMNGAAGSDAKRVFEALNGEVTQ